MFATYKYIKQESQYELHTGSLVNIEKDKDYIPIPIPPIPPGGMS